MSETVVPTVTNDADHKSDAVAIASQAQLTWWAFKRHRMAMIALWVIGIMYVITMFAEFIAPDNPIKQNRRAVFHPPQAIHFLDLNEEGSLRIRPHVLEMDRQRDPETLAISYVPSGDKIYLKLFGKGPEYEFWGLW